MISTYIRSILILSIAILITLLSSNVIDFSNLSSNTLNDYELCIDEDSNNENDSLPDFLELEEEEEIIAHEKRIALIKSASERVLSIIQFGYHIEQAKKLECDLKSPPPRC